MSLCLPDRALLVKLFYQNDNSAIVALRKFRTLKGLRKGPLTAKNLRLMVTKFEETGSLNVRSGRGKKPVSTEAIEKVALQVEENKSSNVLASSVQVFAVWQKHWICLVQLSRRSCETSSVTIHTSFNLCRNCFHMISRLDICSHCSFLLVWKLIQNGLGISSGQTKPTFIWTHPIREQPLSSQSCQNTLNISQPDEARLPRLPDSIDQPITAMPLSRMKNPTFAKPHIQVITTRD
ncbi:DUF4817 domain-containing protein [Trichonephila clavipes]|nr:DUF4817 domain-containing protein [Trichonephila clavipes]